MKKLFKLLVALPLALSVCAVAPTYTQAAEGSGPCLVSGCGCRAYSPSSTACKCGHSSKYHQVVNYKYKKGKK